MMVKSNGNAFGPWIPVGMGLAMTVGLAVLLVAPGGFFLLLMEPARNTGLTGLLAALAGFAMYLGAWVMLGICCRGLWRNRSVDSDGLRPWKFIVTAILAVTFLGTAWWWVDHERDMAVIHGDVERYRELSRLSSKSRLNEDLWESAHRGHTELVRHLLERGADPRARLAINGPTALETAMKNLHERPDGNIKTIQSLKAAGKGE